MVGNDERCRLCLTQTKDAIPDDKRQQIGVALKDIFNIKVSRSHSYS